MEEQNLQNLRIHIAQITSNFVSEISERTLGDVLDKLKDVRGRPEGR